MDEVEFDWDAWEPRPSQALPAFYTISQFAKLLQVSYMTVLRLVETKRIGATRIERQWRIPTGELRRLVDSAG